MAITLFSNFQVMWYPTVLGNFSVIHPWQVVNLTHHLQLNNQPVRQRVETMHCARCTILQEALVPCIIVRIVASMINLGSIWYITVHQVNS